VRVLIFTADIGAGHDLPARLLEEALAARGAETVVVDAIEEAGGILKAATRTGAETVLRRLPWLFGAQYFFLAIFAPTRAAIRWAGTRIGRPVMRRLVAEHRPDVVVSTYPGATEILGHMRATGELAVPVLAEITDLAALQFWAHRGMDAHLIIHDESRAEVAQIAGTRHPIVHARGMVRPAFEHPPSRDEARAALELDAAAPIVLVSGGGWGVGRLEESADAALRAGATVVCLCGSNDELRERLSRRGEPRLRAIGFTERMVEWMAAANVLVHSTAGLTMLEAQLCGTHAVSYGWGHGHIRLNNRAYERFGLAHVAATRGELATLLPRLLREDRPRPAVPYAALPAAADVVLEASGSVPQSTAASPTTIQAPPPGV
jgi:UDP-N-acetylglucosamine:LPS N-acetylglucosamine transferase